MTTVLVADDDLDIRELVAFRLHRDGYTVSLAEDGVQALEMARAERPDLILLDVMMPGLTGFEVARQLRESPDTADQLIILLTARTEPEDLEQGKALGVDDYVTKPFSPLELSMRVAAILERSR